MNTSKDPRPGSKPVTNTEDQDVAVNHSTVQEGGYDEPREQPVSEAAPSNRDTAREEPKPVPAPEGERPAETPSVTRKDTASDGRSPNEDSGKRIYEEEEMK